MRPVPTASHSRCSCRRHTPSLSEINGEAPCYPASSQATSSRNCYKDAVNQRPFSKDPLSRSGHRGYSLDAPDVRHRRGSRLPITSRRQTVQPVAPKHIVAGSVRCAILWRSNPASGCQRLGRRRGCQHVLSGSYGRDRLTGLSQSFGYGRQW
jgi:hypothetical protein